MTNKDYEKIIESLLIARPYSALHNVAQEDT